MRYVPPWPPLLKFQPGAGRVPHARRPPRPIGILRSPPSSSLSRFRRKSDDRRASKVSPQVRTGLTPLFPHAPTRTRCVTTTLRPAVLHRPRPRPQGCYGPISPQPAPAPDPPPRRYGLWRPTVTAGQGLGRQQRLRCVPGSPSPARDNRGPRACARASGCCHRRELDACYGEAIVTGPANPGRRRGRVAGVSDLYLGWLSGGSRGVTPRTHTAWLAGVPSVHVYFVGQAAGPPAPMRREDVLGFTWARRASRGWSRVGSRLPCPDAFVRYTFLRRTPHLEKALA
jgi:hypothetical protein